MRMTKIKFFSASFALFFSLSFSGGQQSPVVEPPTDQVIPDFCNTENRAFQDGEELVYKIYYNLNFVWISAGEVRFRVKDLGSQYHLSAVGNTYESYDWFFKVRDNYQAYVDKNSLLPLMSIRDVHEGGYKLYDKLTYTQSQKKVSSLRGKTKETAKEASYNVSDCMHDIVSIIYYLRNVNYDAMKANDKVPVKIFIDKEEIPLTIRYTGKENSKKIKGLGKFNTIKLSPDVIAGYVFSEESKMTVYASADENRVPLLIESPISVGSVKCVLKSYKGLKYNLSSKVN